MNRKTKYVLPIFSTCIQSGTKLEPNWIPKLS
nr:MAG TPA: hypothetical protein [Caudoviricetes sp.]